MQVYETTVIEGQEWALPKFPADFHLLSDIGGQSQARWSPMEMELLTKLEDGRPREFSHFPWCASHVLVLRREAADVLRDIMNPFGQFLPIAGPVELELFNATTILDALDENQSEIVRFDDGSILNIERLALRPEVIGDTLIFKLPYRASDLYFQAGIIEQFRASGLGGISFKLIWSDETDSVRQVTLPTRGHSRKRSWWRI